MYYIIYKVFQSLSPALGCCWSLRKWPGNRSDSRENELVSYMQGLGIVIDHIKIPIQFNSSPPHLFEKLKYVLLSVIINENDGKV